MEIILKRYLLNASLLLGGLPHTARVLAFGSWRGNYTRFARAAELPRTLRAFAFSSWHGYYMRFARVAGLALISAASLACSSEQQALLLRLQTLGPVESFDLRVRDLDTATTVLDRPAIAHIADGRDTTGLGDPYRLAVEFERGGAYLVHLVGHAPKAAGGGLEVALRVFEVDGVDDVLVKFVPLIGDLDRDGIPSCSAYASCEALADALSCRHLDCDDANARVNAFAEERCGNGLDDDCSAGCGAQQGEGDATCVDGDGDGVVSGQDCDDTDPCRSPTIREGRNLCGAAPDTFVLSQACLEFLRREGKNPSAAPFCGDGIDQDCSGGDEPCVVDDDCDGHAAGAGRDCNDHDPQINKAAEERCGDGVDNNCNDAIDEGCVPCDIDGDEHAAKDASDPDCDLPKDDPDDFDAGISPASTADQPGGVEGGTRATALRGFCSSRLNKDGIAERDVDHDGDGLAASSDGCPSVDCDADGDGFANASCRPSKPEEDCNDTDPTVFPGAPDKCDDNIAQNCIADGACTDDTDGDGYVGDDDCDDSDANTRPWGTERCDAKDNDCDGLVDEGNPDAQGQLVRPQNRCNDSGLGSCAALSGSCGCSKYAPNTDPNPDNRTSCPGEGSGGAASQHCFGAAQPRPERCEPGDLDCDGRDDAPDGKNLADVGAVCGITRGQCRAGTVVGCDLSRSVPHVDVVSSVLGAAFNPHWICSEDTVLPVPEVCAEGDYDCDGRDDAPDGENLADQGRACSTDEGRCRAGTVVGCDLSRSVPYAETAERVLGATFNPYWVCSADTVLPEPESCNGEDDDCDGSLGVYEQSDPEPCCDRDLDYDGFSQCSGDCDDQTRAANPATRSYFTEQMASGGYDYNCDGVEEKRWSRTEDCGYWSGCDEDGWKGYVPECGEVGTYVKCDSHLTHCDEDESLRRQACR